LLEKPRFIKRKLRHKITDDQSVKYSKPIV